MIEFKTLDKLFSRQPGNSLLGLAFDGSRLEGVHVRRTNGSVEIKKAFSATLSLDPLMASPDLATYHPKDPVVIPSVPSVCRFGIVA